MAKALNLVGLCLGFAGVCVAGWEVYSKSPGQRKFWANDDDRKRALIALGLIAVGFILQVVSVVVS